MPVQAELDRIGSPVRLRNESLPLPFICFAWGLDRTAQAWAASEERAFGLDLWAEGVLYLRGQTSDLHEVASVFDAWVSEQSPSGEQMEERFGFLALDRFARVYERGEAIEDAWRHLLEHGGLGRSLHPLIRAAAEEPKLRQLWPNTSMSGFTFSRWVGNPSSNDLPSAYPLENGFRVYGPIGSERQGVVLGEGNAARAVELLLSALPEPLVVLYRRPHSLAPESLLGS